MIFEGVFKCSENLLIEFKQSETSGVVDYNIRGTVQYYDESILEDPDVEDDERILFLPKEFLMNGESFVEQS